MRTTKKSLAADKRQLQAQLAVAAGQTRKTLNARVHSAEQENKTLKAGLASIDKRHNDELELLRNEMSTLQGRVKELETEIKA